MRDNDEQLLAGIQNLNLEEDSDEEEDPVMAAEREARKSLSSLPKWDGRSVPWRNFEDAVSNWRALNGIQAMPAEWQKRSLYFSLTSSAADRARPWRPGSALFNQAATFDDYMTMLRGVFQPAEESEMSRVEFRARSQQKHEDISSYLSSKFALYENAFADDERSFSVLLNASIEGTYSNVIKRMIQRANPVDAESLRTAAIRAVANERSAYRGGYSESTSLDGLETSSMLISVTETSGVEPMEVDKVGAITCYRCDKPGHRKSECRVPAHKISKKKKDKGQGGSKKDKKNLKCYKCDKTGHFARECRSKKEQGAAKGVDEKQLTEQEEEDIFLATTGVVG